MTQKIIDNLELLKQKVEAHEEKFFDLQRFERKTDCGTLYCTAGLAACHPEFQVQGMKLQPLEGQSCKEFIIVAINGTNIGDESRPSDDLFGSHSFDRLFASRDDGDFDKYHPDSEYNYDYDEYALNTHVSDKELALWRIDQQIKLIKEQA